MSKQKKILITGGQGLLGSYLVPLVSRKIPQCQLIVIDKIDRTSFCNDSQNVQPIYGDLKDPKLWARLPTNITCVFHLAAVIPWEKKEKNRANIFIDNILPLTHLVEHSRKWPGLKKVIFSSSISVYAPTGVLLKEDSLKKPVDMYGASKLAAEQLLSCLESRNIQVVSLRYSSLYGYGQYAGTVLPVMVNKALGKKEILVYGNGRRTQDFLYCADAANANLLAYKKEVHGVFNIGSGVPVTMDKLAYTISHVFTKDTAKIIHLPEKEDHDPGYRINVSRAKRELNYQPLFQIEKGLRRLKKEMETFAR